MERIALIPAYEPGPGLVNIVRNLHYHDFSIVVVDDGSGPDYQPTFAQLGCFAHVIVCDENRGKGSALKTGLRYILNHCGECTVVTMDSDGQHLVADAVKVSREAEKGSSDLVIGSRVFSKDSPVRSRFGNAVTRFVYRLATGVGVYDTQSGLRAFRSDLIPVLLEIPGDRYEYEMNVLLDFSKQKRMMTEIPIETIYLDKKNSVSHFHTLSDSVKIYREIFRFCCASLSSFALDFGLYSLLVALLGSGSTALWAANFGARAVSSIFNFTLNKKIVFRSAGDLRSEAAKYFGLVLCNICINSVILTALTSMGCNPFAAKIAVEMVMFVLSYSVQHFFIFSRHRLEA